MADTVDTLVLLSGPNKYVARFTDVSDGTGESAVVKVDISTLRGPNGQVPVAIALLEVLWSIQGFTSVRLFWDHTTDDEIIVLGSGNGYNDFSGVGGLHDPRSAGGTGNVLFTTAGAASGATYSITLVMRLEF